MNPGYNEKNGQSLYVQGLMETLLVHTISIWVIFIWFLRALKVETEELLEHKK